MQGTIRKVKPTYFFILIENDREMFAHLSSWLCKDAPQVDEAVEFDVIQSRKPQFKEQATRVKRVQPATAAAGANALACAIRTIEPPTDVKLVDITEKGDSNTAVKQ